MARDKREREGIEQVKELRGRSPMARPRPMAFRRGRDAVTVGGAEAVGAAGQDAALNALRSMGVKPWGQDRVTLTLKAQMLMVEQRANVNSIARMNLDYRNQITILELKPGFYLKIEPDGCYRLSYNKE